MVRLSPVFPSGTNPVTGVTYSTSSTTNPLGALTGVTFGSADSDAFIYDPNTGRMKTYAFTVNGNADTGTLNWNANGTLQQLAIVDNIPNTKDSQTCNYTYDDLARIGGQDANGYRVDCGSSWQQLFTYDSFGNITKTGTSSFVPIYSATQNQFTSIPGANLQYDGGWPTQPALGSGARGQKIRVPHPCRAFCGRGGRARPVPRAGQRKPAFRPTGAEIHIPHVHLTLRPTPAMPHYCPSKGSTPRHTVVLPAPKSGP